MSEILTWHELGSAFPHSAIEAVDSAISSVLVSELPGRETNYLTAEGMTFSALKALDSAGFTITKKEN